MLNYTDDYDKIMLSSKEKRILRQIIKKKEVLDTFCTDSQKHIFFKYGLITIHQPQTVLPTGRVVQTPDAQKSIRATDKAFRYFIYRKESYFKGKFPVVIAFIALIKSFDREIGWLVSLIADWLSKL